MIRRGFAVLAASGKKKPNMSIFSIPVNLGQPLLGPDRSPALLKEHGLFKLIENTGWEYKDYPEINSTGCSKVDPSNELEKLAKNCHQVGYVCEKAFNAISPRAATDDFILILGGDHCIPIGTIPAIVSKRPSTGVVWVDAHADINVPLRSGSHNMHGMPLGFLMNLVENVNAYPNMSWFKPCLQPRDVVYIGLRDLDNDEKLTIKKLGIKAFTMREVDKYGIGRVMEEVNYYFRDKENIHLSYDIDALDPFYAPSTGTAVRGGLTFREGNYICEELFSTGKLNSLDLVEVNPSLHTENDANRTIEMALTIVGSAIGNDILDGNLRR